MTTAVSLLEELTGTMSNAARVRILSRLSTPPEGLPSLLQDATEETRALGELARLRTQIETVRTHGNEAELAVLSRLETVVLGSTKVRVADSEPALKVDIEKAFSSVMVRLRTVPPPPPQPDPDPEPGPGRKKTASRARSAVAARDLSKVAAEIAADVAREIGGDSCDVTVQVTRR